MSRMNKKEARQVPVRHALAS